MFVTKPHHYHGCNKPVWNETYGEYQCGGCQLTPDDIRRGTMAMLWSIDPDHTPWKEWTLEKCLAQIEEYEHRTGRRLNKFRRDLGLPIVEAPTKRRTLGQRFTQWLSN